MLPLDVELTKHVFRPSWELVVPAAAVYASFSELSTCNAKRNGMSLGSLTYPTIPNDDPLVVAVVPSLRQMAHIAGNRGDTTSEGHSVALRRAPKSGALRSSVQVARWLVSCVEDIQSTVLGSVNSTDIASEYPTSMACFALQRCPLNRKRRRQEPSDCLTDSNSIEGVNGSQMMRCVGVCVAKELAEAYRACYHDGEGLSANHCSRSTSSLSLGDYRVHGASICGIELVWIDPSFRRRGFASCLVDTARTHLVYGGHEIPKSAVAFSEPTVFGAHLASAYSGTPEFLTFQR